MIGKAELAYQQLCGEITVEFNDCSKQVCFIVSNLKGKNRYDCVNNDWPFF